MAESKQLRDSSSAPLSPEQSAFLSEICRTNYAWLYKYARSKLSPDDAEDLIQELFLLAARKVVSLMDSPSPSGWLAKSLRFLISDWWERESVRNRYHADAVDETFLVSSSHELSDVDLELSVKAALTDEEYKLYYLIYREERPMTDVAKSIGATPAAVWKRMERIRKRLRKEIFS